MSSWPEPKAALKEWLVKRPTPRPEAVDLAAAIREPKQAALGSVRRGHFLEREMHLDP